MERKDMNTVQLECFLTVAEYLNFSKASEALKLTQPAGTRSAGAETVPRSHGQGTPDAVIRNLQRSGC